MTVPEAARLEEPGSKSVLRRRLTASIAALDPDVRRAQDAALIARFRGPLPGFERAATVLLFVSARPEEPPTSVLFTLAYDLKKTVLCPRVDRREGRLTLHRIVDPKSEFQPGYRGIPEPRRGVPRVAPTDVDWALIPGLAFDDRGFRLGRGRGYYDRLIPTLRRDAICWAVCLPCQLVEQLPAEPHDAPLNGVSTPTRDIKGTRPTQSF